MKKEKNLYLILGIATFFLFAFEVETSNDNNKTFKQLESFDINNLIVNTTANVYFISSNKTAIQIEGNRELVKNLEAVQQGDDLIIQVKDIYNPIKLLKLAYLSRKPLNIYLSSPRAMNISVKNRESFELSEYYESGESKMMILKSPKLFSQKALSGATCSSFATSIY